LGGDFGSLPLSVPQVCCRHLGLRSGVPGEPRAWWNQQRRRCK
jgi:hypothetical protein